MGGSLGRTEATGYGVIYTLREALKELGIKPEETCASFQGFGNVAQYAAQLYSQMGGKIVAIACWDNIDKKSYTYKCEGWAGQRPTDANNRCLWQHRQGKRAQSVGCGNPGRQAWLEQDVDILIPAALETR